MHSHQSHLSQSPISQEKEVDEFLGRHPIGRKLNKILSRPHLLEKRISPEGKAALFVRLTQEKVIDTLDLDVYISSDADFENMFRHCWPQYANLWLRKNTKPPKKSKNQKTFTKMILGGNIGKPRETLYDKIERILMEIVNICCNHERINVLIEFYNFMCEEKIPLAKIFTKQIVQLIFSLPAEDKYFVDHTLMPMLEYLEYQENDSLKESLKEYLSKIK